MICPAAIAVCVHMGTNNGGGLGGLALHIVKIAPENNHPLKVKKNGKTYPRTFQNENWYTVAYENNDFE